MNNIFHEILFCIRILISYMNEPANIFIPLPKEHNISFCNLLTSCSTIP